MSKLNPVKSGTAKGGSIAFIDRKEAKAAHAQDLLTGGRAQRGPAGLADIGTAGRS
jgi:hypothetical protein